MKSDKFKKEINYIKDNKYKTLAENILNSLPDYFYEVPASSTGKYHPEFTLGNGGLVRHTKAAVIIARELLNNNSVNSFTQREKDLIIIAILIHDGLKSGQTKSDYTKFEHPLLVCEHIQNNKDAFNIEDEDLTLIKSMVSSHMGEWNTNQYSDITLPKPETKYQRFVHMCDYLASRKYINIKFDEYDNIIE